MGVKDLWSILKDLSEKKDLAFLFGKRVAVDLSGWVVQATTTGGLKETKMSYIRHLFFRVQYLLNNGVHPIFVMEGKMPALKLAAFKKRNGIVSSSTENFSRSSFDRVLRQCQDLLKCLGVPCIKSSGEAEALCAFLNANKIVDGVITEDNDAFLYGADTVFRDFAIDDPHTTMYSLKSPNNKMCLNRPKLVAIALLLGCDYVEGVSGIGKEAALKLLQELQDCDDILQRFKDWKQVSASQIFPGYDRDAERKRPHCNNCSHIGTFTKHRKEGCEMCKSENTCLSTDDNNPCSCSWHEIGLKRKTELKVYHAVENVKDFPNMEVIKEYLNYTDKIPREEEIDWKSPNLQDFQATAFKYLGFTMENSLKKCLSIIISWQHYKLSKPSPLSASYLLYQPFSIVKSRTVNRVKSLEVQWIMIGNESEVDDDLITIENEERFKKSYPEIAKSYHESIEAKNVSKAKQRSSKSPKQNKKMTDFFREQGKTGGRKGSKIQILKFELDKRGSEYADNSEEPCVKKQCCS